MSPPCYIHLDLSLSKYYNRAYFSRFHGHHKLNEFIVCQHPTEKDQEDFWRMLWEHNSTIVVMLTKLREMGRVSQESGYQPFVVLRGLRIQTTN